MVSAFALSILLVAYYIGDLFLGQIGERHVAYDISAVAILLYVMESRITSFLHYRRMMKIPKLRPQLKMQRGFFLMRLGLALACVFFLGLWLARWRFGLHTGLDSIQSQLFRIYLTAGIFSLIIAEILRDDKIVYFLNRLEFTPGRTVFVLYSVAALIGSFTLIMPWNLQPRKTIELIDALFVSVSALSVTGLSPIDIATTFTKSGLVSILVMIQAGGIGIVAIAASLASITRQHLHMASSLMGTESYDLPDLGQMSSFIGRVIGFTFGMETIGTIWIYFSLPATTPDRLFHAIFHAISAFCNAGFSSFSQNLNVQWATPLTITGVSILVFFGSLGFPLIFETVDRLKKNHPRRYFSSNSILTVSTMSVVIVVGFVGFFLADYFSAHGNRDVLRLVGQSIFYTINSRTAGFNITPIAEFSQGAVLIVIAMMFIGGNPLSTAGGIKSTTIGILLATTGSFLRGHKWVQFRNREIPNTTIFKAIAIVVIYIFAATLAVLILMASEGIDAWHLLFEVASAITTCGLSLGATPYLTPLGKLVIVVLMMTGRLGIITLVFVGMGRISGQRFPLSQRSLFCWLRRQYV